MMNTIDIETGRRVPIDPWANLTKQSSAQEESDVRMSAMVAGLLDGRHVLSKAASDAVRKMNDGQAPLSIVDVNQGLTRFVASPSQVEGAIANRVAPVRLVPQPRGNWFAEDNVDAIEEATPVRMHLDEQPHELAPQFKGAKYSCQLWSLATRVPAQLSGTADFDLTEIALVRLAHALVLLREKRVAKLALASASWASANVAAAGFPWNSSGTPITDIWARRNASTLPTNALVMSEAVERYFYGSSQVRDYVQSGGKLPEILIGRMKSGPVGAPAYIWGTPTAASAVLIRAASSPSDIGSMQSIRWNAIAPAARTVEGIFVRTAYLREAGTMGAHLVVAALAEDVRTFDTAATTGGLITGVIA